MKLKILFTLTLLVSVLAGCTQVTDSNDTQGLSGDQTIAYSTYMAGAFLSESTTSQEDNTTSSSQGEVMNLATGSEDNEDDAMLKIEEELGEASEYFNRLKVFLDNGMENPFVIDQDIDVEGDYDITMQYTVEEKTYTILLNEDEDGSLAGTLILDGVEYDVEGYREVETEDEDEDEESDEDDGEDEGSDDESDQEEDTDDDADSEDEEDTEENNTVETEEEIYLKTVDKENSDNYIEITIETETEDEEYEFEMELESYIDNVEKELKIEFEVEDDEVSIELETENGNVYEFSRETEEDTDIDYEFEYEIDGTEGEVDLTVTTDEQGNKVYNYHIEEDGQEKDVEEREDDDDDDEDDEDDQDDEEDEDDDDTDDEDDEEETA